MNIRYAALFGDKQFIIDVETTHHHFTGCNAPIN